MKNFKNSISYQLLLYVLIIYFSVTFIITSVHLVFEYNHQKDLMKQELSTLSNATKKAFENALWDMNDNQLKAEVNGIMQFPIVKAVEIVGKNEKVLIERFDISCMDCKNSSFTSTKKITRRLFDKEILLGEVKLYSTIDIIIDRVKINFGFILFNAMIKSIVLVILFAYAFKKFLSTPLRDILSQIDTIDVNKIDKQRIELEDDGKSELASMKKSINKMLEKIDEQFLNLQENEEILQEKVKRRTKELEEKNQELETLATTDALTKIFNRRKIEEKLKEEIHRSKRFNHSFGVILVDIDNFKDVNDNYGHQVGDSVLKEIANLLQSNIRVTDSVGRWGGEEFIILLPESTLEGALELAGSLKIILDEHTFPYVKNKTGSFGVTIYNQGETIKELLNRADKALYLAKDGGKNCVKSF